MNAPFFDPAAMAARGAEWTAREIAQQPAAWARVAEEVARAGLPAWVAARLADPDLRVVLTGAGTSAYVGECLAPLLAHRWSRPVEAIATTDLVAAPRHAFPDDRPTLLVSFARSGNSPESVAAVDCADAALPRSRCHHLVLTCNGEGALAAAVQAPARGAERVRVHVLPACTHDRAFAMTSSFTSMLAACAQAFDLMPAASSEAGAQALAQGVPLARTLAAQGFTRVVYLGGNALQGLAHEAALKMLELTDGQVVAVHESPLGFRHGPKTIVDARTLVVLFLSHDPHVRRYDLDLLAELRRDARAMRVLAVSGRAADARDGLADLVLPALDDAGEVDTLAPFAVFAQALALERSLSLGLTPDQPCTSGTVHRVVRGVTIHDWPGATTGLATGGGDVPRR